MGILGRMSKTLTSLRIAGTVAFALPNILKWHSTIAVPFFPKLKDLTLFDFNFQVEEGPTYLRLLQDALAHRAQLDPHRMLHRLWFKDCYFPVGGVPSLEEYKGCCERLTLSAVHGWHKLDCSEDYAAIEHIYEGSASTIFGHYGYFLTIGRF